MEMCIKKTNEKKKPAKLVSIICTARNGQFISMLYGIIIFFQPYVHLFKIADKDFCLFMKKIESRITVYEKCVFHVFFLIIFYFLCGAVYTVPAHFDSQCLSYLSL